jgi:predicted nucleic acid-binding protein
VPAVLVDTGPLVALLDRSDPYHLTCQETLSSLDDSLVTVWPVVTEAMYMLRAYWQAQDALWEMIGAGAVEIIPLGIEDLPRMRELMRKYRDQPMDLADAALVRVAERERLRRIFTLDRRDFQIYRLSRIGRFAVLPSR